MTKREEIEILKQRLEVALKRIEALERDIAKISSNPAVRPPAPFDFDSLRKEMEKAKEYEAKEYEKMTRPQEPAMPIYPWTSPVLCGVAQGVKA